MRERSARRRRRLRRSLESFVLVAKRAQRAAVSTLRNPSCHAARDNTNGDGEEDDDEHRRLQRQFGDIALERIERNAADVPVGEAENKKNDRDWRDYDEFQKSNHRICRASRIQGQGDIAPNRAPSQSPGLPARLGGRTALIEILEQFA
jgi:hypothetical protein